MEWKWTGRNWRDGSGQVGSRQAELVWVEEDGAEVNRAEVEGHVDGAKVE